jgi:hypothetical protein
MRMRLLVSYWLLGCMVAGNSASAQVFHDVFSDHDIEFMSGTSDNWGASVSFFDFDNDGWDDITLTAENDSLYLFRNTAGVFEKMSSPLYTAGRTKQALWVDYDNDGDYDLVVTTYYGTYRLYQNDGSFNFTDVTALAGFNPVNSRTYGVSFGDYNRDGFLDAYICLYEVGHTANNLPKLNQLYRNNGDGTFTNVTQSAGVGDSIQTSFQAAWIDFDNDGWQDIFVINDRSLFKNSMYRNNGDGTFTDVAQAAGIQMPGENPMSTTVGDFNNDGFLDIYITNTGNSPYYARLFLNNGDGTYDEVGDSLGVALAEWGWSSIWLDYDNDGWHDLFVATGKQMPFPFNDPNYFFRNIGGDFVDSSAIMTNSPFALSTAAAKGDLNNDGFYDFIVRNEPPFEPFLWQNTGNSNNHIKITLEGTVSNKMAVGSYIRLYADGASYVDYILCGENYISQNSQHRIFGLGNTTIVDSVHVTYLSGHTDYYYDLPVNQHYYFIEGETLSAEVVAPSLSMCKGESIQLEIPGLYSSVGWSNGDMGSSLLVDAPGSFYAQITSEHGIVFYSDTVEVAMDSIPAVEITVVDVDCFGAASGMVAVTASSADSISWSNGANTWDVEALQQGTYEFTLYFGSGCTVVGQVSVSAPPEMVVFHLVTNESNGNDGEIHVQVFGGTQPYQYFLDGEGFVPPAINLTAQSYEVEVIDANGCSDLTQLHVGSTVALTELSQEHWVLSPNPTHDGVLVIEGIPDGRNWNVSIFNTSGAKVFDQFVIAPTFSITMETSLENGMYFVQLDDLLGNQTKTFRFIKH